MSQLQPENRKSVIVPRKMRWGLLAYQTPEGYLFSNEEGDVLNIEVRDITNHEARKTLARKLSEAAMSYGAPEGGDIVFIPGKKRVSQDQYDHQVGQMREGKPIDEDWHPDDFKEE